MPQNPRYTRSLCAESQAIYTRHDACDGNVLLQPFLATDAPKTGLAFTNARKFVTTIHDEIFSRDVYSMEQKHWLISRKRGIACNITTYTLHKSARGIRPWHNMDIKRCRSIGCNRNLSQEAPPTPKCAKEPRTNFSGMQSVTQKKAIVSSLRA